MFPFRHSSLYTILPLALLLQLCASCSRQNSNDDIESESPFFSVGVVGVTATTLSVRIEPADGTIFYTAALLTSDEYLSDTSDAAIIMKQTQHLNSALLQAENTGQSLSLADLLYEGVQTLHFRHLTSSASYQLCLFRFDTKDGSPSEQLRTIGKVERFPITTTAISKSAMLLSIDITGDDTLSITPTTAEPYIFFYETIDDWFEFTNDADPTQEAIEAEINDFVIWYDNEGYPLPIYKGTQHFRLSDPTLSLRTDTYYIFFAAPYTEAVNGEAAYLIAFIE